MINNISIKQYLNVHKKVFLNLITRYRFNTIIIIILLCLLTFKDILNLKFIEYITNTATIFVNNRDSFALKSAITTISALILLIIFSYLLNWIYEIINNKFKEKIRFDIEKDFRKKLSSLPYDLFENNQFHEKIKRAKSAGDQYGEAIYNISTFFRIIVTMIAYSFMLAKVSMVFPFVVIISNIITFYLSGVITDKQLEYWRKFVSPSTRQLLYFQNIIGNRINHQTIQTGNLFSYFSKKVHHWNKTHMKQNLKLNTMSFITELASASIQAIVYSVTAIYIGFQVINGKTNIGYFTMVLVLLTNLFGTLKEFSYFVLNSNWYVKVLDDYYDVMLMPVSKNYNEDNNNLNFSKVRLKNISFKYPQSEKYAIKDINLSFRFGEKIAIVGPNGSGKTTIMSILMGLFNNFEGNIEIDNNKNSKQSIPILSNNISCLLQDFGQYNMSIKENIELGLQGKKISEKKVNNLLKEVGLYNFVFNLDKGIYTQLGQLKNGIELSKGQWQRLAVARLLANNKAKIWILDEPTAYLDPIAEIEMYKFIYTLAKKRLVFFISHRLGFAKQADRIIVLNNGYIAEQGNHIELIKKQGLYFKMYETQKNWYKT